MIKEIDENVFDSNADCIINTVNCVGFMGKGLALEFSLRYPELEKIYKNECKNKMIRTGSVYFYNINGQKIINFPTKFHYKYPSKIEWIEQGLDSILMNYKKWNIKSLGIPLLGARNGGLDSNEIINLIKTKLKEIDIPVFICLNKKPDKVSEDLLNKFIASNLNDVAEDLNLNKKQTLNLVNAQKKIISFGELSNIPSIGSSTYKKIFEYFSKNQNRPQKISLFNI